MSKNVMAHLLSPLRVGLLLMVLGGSILALAAESIPDSGAAKPQAALDVKTGRSFWAFGRVKKIEPHVVGDADWSKSPIDRFLFAAMAERGLKPAPPAT